MEHKMTNQENIELHILNLPELQEKVKMAGFGDHFNDQIREEVLSGRAQFSISRSLQIDKDKMEYKMDIRMDKVKRKGYLNDMHATLTEDSGVERSQLSVNAKAGRLDLRGANLELMDLRQFSRKSGGCGDIK